MNELNVVLDPSQTALTVTARLRAPGGAQVGSDIATTESGTRPGWYSGDVPGATLAGVYEVEFFSGADYLGGGDLVWDGTQEISALDISTISIADVQTALTNQGYTAARAAKLDNLDAAISSVITSIGTIPIQAAVIAALTTQGYTAGRAIKLDNLDAAISAVITAIMGISSISITDVQTALTNQGYTSGRAVFLDNLPTLLAGVERIRKITGNKVVVSVDELTVTVFEDDETTVAFTFTISADKRTRTPN